MRPEKTRFAHKRKWHQIVAPSAHKMVATTDSAEGSADCGSLFHLAGDFGSFCNLLHSISSSCSLRGTQAVASLEGPLVRCRDFQKMRYLPHQPCCSSHSVFHQPILLTVSRRSHISLLVAVYALTVVAPLQ